MKLKKALLMTLGAGLVITTTISYSNIASAEGTFSSEATINFSVPEEATAPVDPLEPEQPLDPKEIVEDNITGDTAPLSFDYASNIDFGSEDVELEGGTYQAEGGVDHIQISDDRGPANGWTVTASTDGFSNNGAPSLPGAEIVLTDGDAASTSSSTAPDVNDDIRIEAGEGPVQIATAAGGELGEAQGLGTWVVRWVDSEPETDGNSNVSLVIPAASATAGQHTATINWTLTNGPAGTEES